MEEQNQVEESKANNKHNTAKKLDVTGWALFFIWIGIAFLADLGFGLGLLGVGVIILAVQIARTRSKLKLEVFWVIVSLLFLLGGLWELFEPELPLVPILLILAGLIMLISTLLGKHRDN